jgi:hypothetical protein
MIIYTSHDLIKFREKERINGNLKEDYRVDLYKRYTGKDPNKIVYNGFKVTRPGGTTSYYTIHYRTDNTRPYAIYLDGDQIPHKTYIKRFYLEKLLKQIACDLQATRPDFKIDHLRGTEIIT